jgi:hypothetical protein
VLVAFGLDIPDQLNFRPISDFLSGGAKGRAELPSGKESKHIHDYDWQFSKRKQSLRDFPIRGELVIFFKVDYRQGFSQTTFTVQFTHFIMYCT